MLPVRYTKHLLNADGLCELRGALWHLYIVLFGKLVIHPTGTEAKFLKIVKKLSRWMAYLVLLFANYWLVTFLGIIHI